MKRIILCADDYGQNESISQAIVELLQKSSISAVSCLTTFPCWASTAAQLKPYSNQVDIGLHFNLTEGMPLSTKLNAFYSLPKLILKSQLRALNKHAIAAELNAQINAFMQAMGREPDFIDGHQHIHQFPIVRDVLLETYKKRFPNKNVYLRSTLYSKTPKMLANRKYWIINFCGGIAFKKLLLTNHISHNTSFNGIYNLNPGTDYVDTFSDFLANIEDNGLIMCHPGFNNTLTADVIGASRENEFAFFNSDVFKNLLNIHNIQLARFKFNID